MIYKIKQKSKNPQKMPLRKIEFLIYSTYNTFSWERAGGGRSNTSIICHLNRQTVIIRMYERNIFFATTASRELRVAFEVVQNR